MRDLSVEFKAINKTVDGWIDKGYAEPQGRTQIERLPRRKAFEIWVVAGGVCGWTFNGM